MNSRGFALVAVLWLITAISATAMVVVAAATAGMRASGNRVILARARWARLACGDILASRYQGDSTYEFRRRVDLGRGTWCETKIVPDSVTADQRAAGKTLTIEIVGGVRGFRVRSGTRLRVAKTPGRLAVLRREVIE